MMVGALMFSHFDKSEDGLFEGSQEERANVGVFVFGVNLRLNVARRGSGWLN